MILTVAQAATLTFLALDIWREARGESGDCQIAVGGTVLNRVERPSWWGQTVMGVLFKKWQYSSLTNPTDRQLATWPVETDVAWQQCLRIADGLLAKTIYSAFPHADSYYDTSIPAPPWATDDVFCGQIGKIRFYNLDHDIEAGSCAIPST